MADKKISELPFGQLDSSSIIAIVTNSITSQTTFGQMLSLIPSPTGIKWYAENATAPSIAPIATGFGSIAIGNKAEAKSNDMFIVGYNAGNAATGATYSNFLGREAGLNATNAQQSNFLGASAGQNASGASNSNFFGTNAGLDAKNAYSSNFFGTVTGSLATNANNSNFFGNWAGYKASGASNSNFFGQNTGWSATSASNSNFFGFNAGKDATGADNSNFFGTGAGQSSTGNNVNAFGDSAGNGNLLNGQTIFSNTSLPSYADRSAAEAAITIGDGASAGSTYLYYNETTFGIEAIRL